MENKGGQVMLADILNVGIYSVVGIVLMIFGTFLIDLIIPCNFPEEIKKRNVAVGYIMAGASIAVGIILKSCVMSPTVVTQIEEKFVQGLLSSVIYFAIGMVFCMLGYIVINAFHRRYDLNNEIGEGNPAAGIMVCGLFIGLAIIISGVIY